jgi:hypothetical protein
MTSIEDIREASLYSLPYNKLIDSSQTRRYSTSTSTLLCNGESLNRPSLHPRSPPLTMQIRLQPTWQEKVEAKRAKTRSKIPEEWTLNKEGLAAAKKQRQFSGPFIESFLDGHELEITSKDNVPLLAKIRSDHYTLFR